MAEVLTRQALNRATLARQMLLERQSVSALDAIEHLAGMQAQAANAPYVGLWNRINGFRIEELAELVADRSVARASLMRGTIHLASARDCLAWRPLVQTVYDRTFPSTIFAKNLVGLDLAPVLAEGRRLVEGRPLTREQLAPLLAEKWPDRDLSSLAYAVSILLPTVQVPPRGIWGTSGQATLTTIESWLGSPLAASPSIEEMVLRYLGAFGPATAMDAQAWSGLTRLGEVLDRLRPQLRTFRDENGKELFDLPEAPRPDPTVPAPVRLLPEYDNLLFAFADRTRVMAAGRKPPLYAGNGGNFGSVLLDGVFEGSWKLVRKRAEATLTLDLLRKPTKVERSELMKEGKTLLAFAASESAQRDVQIFTVP